MKKILLLMMCWPTILSAQPGVKITGLAVEAGTVTLDVRWEPLAPPTVWSDTVWVFVDYNDNGTMKRLELSEGATLTATSAPDVGKLEQLAGNKKGVRVIGNARSAGSFSATVKLLTATTNVAGACVYASNYPPVGEYATASSITFTGTPPFDLVLSPGGQTSVQQGYVLLEGEKLLSFSDKTGAPGIIKCIPPATYNLIASASGFCADDAAGVTFSLNNTQTGVKYQLYRDGTTAVGTVLIGTGSTLPFSGSFKVAGVYTAKSVAESGYCAAAMTGSLDIAAYSAITAGTIESGSTTTDAGADPGVTITSSGAASGGSGSYTYLWLRTGTSSPATLTTDDNVTAYTIASLDYSSAGTYYFNRYAKDKACVTAVWVAASGTYTLGVESVGTNQPQGSCTFTQPAVVGTFANFNKNYSASTYVTLTDARDYKNYAVVKIGGRWIMAQNLNYQGVAGTSSSLTWQANAKDPVTESGGQITDLIGHFWCPGPSNPSTRASCDVWGALYSWETAMMVDGKWSSASHSSSAWSEPTSYGMNTAAGNTQNHARRDNGATTFGGRGICPPNWHVPTDAEWGDILNAMESGSGTTHNTGWHFRGSDAGARMKAGCVCEAKIKPSETHVCWPSDHITGGDAYRFRMICGGYANKNYTYFDSVGALWSATASGNYYAIARRVQANASNVVRDNNTRSDGLSVRCVRDH